MESLQKVAKRNTEGMESLQNVTRTLVDSQKDFITEDSVQKMLEVTIQSVVKIFTVEYSTKLNSLGLNFSVLGQGSRSSIVENSTNGEKLIITNNHVAGCHNTSGLFGRLIFIGHQHFITGYERGLNLSQQQRNVTQYVGGILTPDNIAHVVKYSQVYDYCILNVPKIVNLPNPLQSTAELFRGKRVWAVGYPYHAKSITAAEGIISQTDPTQHRFNDYADVSVNLGGFWRTSCR